jgi:hypothetical protein
MTDADPDPFAVVPVTVTFVVGFVLSGVAAFTLLQATETTGTGSALTVTDVVADPETLPSVAVTSAVNVPAPP